MSRLTSKLHHKKEYHITSFRKDLVSYGRSALVDVAASLNDDVKRRDFTINSLYLDSQGNLTDFLNGENDLIKRMDGAINSFNGDLAGLRTGRASTNMVDGILVDAYGQKMPIDQVGSISVPEARMISIQVWDKGLVVALSLIHI